MSIWLNLLTAALIGANPYQWHSGVNCVAGSFATGVDARLNAEGCTAVSSMLVPTATAVPTATPANTAVSTATAVPTATVIWTATPIPPVPTDTPANTAVPTATAIATVPTATAIATVPTATAIATPTVIFTATLVPTPTPRATDTAIPTATAVALLPIANGGTNNSAAYTAGSVIFSDGTKLTQDNANFFWDDTNNRLGIGTISPTARLHLPAGSSSASTAPLKIPTGNLNTTAEAGAIEHKSGRLYFTDTLAIRDIVFVGDYQAISGDFTTTSTSLVDVTGLTFLCPANSSYLLEINLQVASTSAAGIKVGVTGSGTAGIGLGVLGTAGSATATRTERLTALSTATSAFVTFNSDGILNLNGLVSCGVTPGNIQVQVLKVTSGTATVYGSSWIRAMHYSGH